MNRAIFTGRLTKDPELRYTNDGRAVCTINIAVDDGWGEKKQTYFPDIVLWRHNAEYIGKFAHKGDLIETISRYTERKWEDREGRKRTSVEFVADEVHILSARRGENGQGGAQAAPGAPRAQGAGYQDPGGYGGQARQVWSPPQNENGGEYEELDGSDGDLPF